MISNYLQNIFNSIANRSKSIMIDFDLIGIANLFQIDHESIDIYFDRIDQNPSHKNSKLLPLFVCVNIDNNCKSVVFFYV
jgi:hypothetical protein